MTKIEFLQKLKEALEQELGPQAVQENLEYYNQYIAGEMQNGKSETEVTQMLGDPWVIARTIIDTQSGQGQGEFVYDTPDRTYQRETTGNNVHVFAFDAWWKKLLLVLAIIGIICVVFAIVTGIVSLVAPIVIPVLIIMLVVRLLGGRRR